GRQRGKAVKQRLVMPITFSLGGHPDNAKISLETPVEGTKQTMKVTGNLIEENGERYVTGRVVDASGKPTPGMSIILVGTSRGTVSDPNGNYKLKVDNSNGRISFSHLGFETEFLAF
ncbi:MAG: carboxypeptidase-like regulatory domain-containing protein, partial [Cyclobacteriaceae bacterium]